MTNEHDPQLVDMVAIARENALADAMLSRPGMVKVVAPAKVNLFLNVGEVRDDGYHGVENILHAVMLHDIVYVRTVPGDQGQGLRIAIMCSGRDGVEAPDIAPEDNIAHRAVTALAEAIGRAQDETVEVAIVKRIPHQAGLGGGSSDAAATLAGLAHVWGVDLNDPAIERTARRLGKDVAFFLRGGCALYDEAGEAFVRTLAPRHESVVLVRPEGGLSTAAVYREFDCAPYPIDPDLRSRAIGADDAASVPFANNLAPAAERLMPELERVRTWLESQDGVTEALLCGSGSTTFGVCDDFATACAVAAKAGAQGWWARATSFSGIRSSVVPDK